MWLSKQLMLDYINWEDGRTTFMLKIINSYNSFLKTFFFTSLWIFYTSNNMLCFCELKLLLDIRLPITYRLFYSNNTPFNVLESTRTFSYFCFTSSKPLRYFFRFFSASTWLLQIGMNLDASFLISSSITFSSSSLNKYFSRSYFFYRGVISV